ncbi:MAG: GMC family oxidoreductase N-terminal domain-containing protein [Alphaproteobacteria bacterium]|nr:GMC family oxidoreductase N-terminal domain-containing protein [Alphaproteobacteria bacterium]
MQTYDYIIVGAGSAGCILANRLSEDPGVSVCLLEAGGRDINPYIHVPAGFIKTFYDPSVNWNYDMEPGDWTGGRRIHAPRGKTLGGSSAINGHVYNRGQRFDFDTWAQFGNRGWGYADVLPYFRRTERREATGDDTYRGRDGHVSVTDLGWRHPLCDAFIEGAVQNGIPRNPDYNGERQEGVTYVQRTVKDGRRVSTATSYLKPALKRRNLTVLTRAHSTEIILEGKRAVGVRYLKGGRGGVPSEVRAGREVILSSGTYNSPMLLQLSGIGPADVLKDLGIPVRHALKGVGENLRDHYAPRFAARVKNARTINEMTRGVSLMREAVKYMFTRKGVLALSPTLVYLFWHSGETAETSDIQMTFTPASYNEGVQGELEREPGMTVASWQQRPESRGYVRARSTDPFDKPIIQPNYLSEELDRRVLLGAMKLARKLMHSDPLKPYIDYEAFPGPDVQTDDELLGAAKQRGTTTFHPMGSCKMGPSSDPLSVVDDQLRVHGIEGLRVIDASIMPTMLSANLNAATMMIAEKGSDMVRGRAALEATTLAH